MNNIQIELLSKISKAKAKLLLGYEIPNELQLEINKLMCDYNEQLKKESNGK